MREHQPLLSFNQYAYTPILNFVFMIDRLENGILVDMNHEHQLYLQLIENYLPLQHQQRLEAERIIMEEIQSRSFLPANRSDKGITEWLKQIEVIILAALRKQLLGIDLKNLTVNLLEMYQEYKALFHNKRKNFIYELISAIFKSKPNHTHVDPNAIAHPHDGKSFLCHALATDDSLLVELFIKLGTTTKRIDKHGQTAWSIAATCSLRYLWAPILDSEDRNMQRLLQLFHDTSADKNEINMNNDQRDTYPKADDIPRYGLGYETALSAAIFSGKIDNAIFLIKLGADINAVVHHASGFTALHWGIILFSLTIMITEERENLFKKLKVGFSDTFLTSLVDRFRNLTAKEKIDYSYMFGDYIHCLLLFGASESIKDNSGLIPKSYLIPRVSQSLYALGINHEKKLEACRKKIVICHTKKIPTSFWVQQREISGGLHEMTSSIQYRPR